MKHLLDHATIYLKKCSRDGRVDSSSPERIDSHSSTVVFLSDEKDESKSNLSKHNDFQNVDIAFHVVSSKQKMPEDKQHSNCSALNENNLVPEEVFNRMLDKMIDLTNIQYDDMKQYFETQTMEIRNDIKLLKRKQDDTRGLPKQMK